MSPAGKTLRVLLYGAAGVAVYIWLELRIIERATSTKFHSNGRRHEQHRSTSNP